MAVTLTGTIDVPADQLDIIRPALAEHVRLTREEPGNVRFDITENLQVPGRFEVDEEFLNSDAFRAHQTRGQNSAWGEITAGMPRNFQVNGLDPE